MSNYRERLIAEGKLVTVETQKSIESLAKQLFTVFRKRLDEIEEQAEELPEEGEAKPKWEVIDLDLKELYRAQARYVLSTYTENARLREKNKQLEATIEEFEARYRGLIEEAKRQLRSDGVPLL